MRFRLIDLLESLRRLMESTWLLLWHLYVILMKARIFGSSVIVILTSTLCVGTFVHEDFGFIRAHSICTLTCIEEMRNVLYKGLNELLIVMQNTNVF
jgi:hypothetical protein